MGKMRQLRRELRACVGKALAYQINDGRGAAMSTTLRQVIRGQRVHDDDLCFALADDDAARDQRSSIAERLAAPMVIPAGKGGKATALVSMRGIALYDVEFQPYCFSTLLLARIMTDLANDPEIGTIVLDIDSPGGVVTGTPEAGDAIYAARQGKRVVALVNPLAASAAYWLASQASEVIAVPSADVGSIGVFMLHADCSGLMEQMGVKPTFIFAGKYKTEANPYEPLSGEAAKYLQGEVDTCYRDFLKAVARGRGVDVSNVEEDMGQGRCMMAPMAKKAGMIDRIATVDAAFARWGISAAMLQGRRRGEDASTLSGGGGVAHWTVAEIIPASEQAMTPINLRQDMDDNGHTDVYVLEPWPEKTSVCPRSFDSKENNGWFGMVGDTLHIACRNGAARYRKIGVDTTGAWIFVLEDSAYEPPPSAPTEASQSQSGAEKLRQANETVERGNRAAARRRRIDLLNA